MMKNKLEKLEMKYLSAERELIKELMKLKNGGQECNCSSTDRRIIRTIHEGEFPEIITRCLNCGGDVV
jgi:hypothetical protein